MTRMKEGNTTASQPSTECCMCGDYGLSYELFRCKHCQFRSQHRYCSNQYPKAESYRVCNWCLSQKDDSVEKTQNSSNSSSSGKSKSDQEDIKNKRKNNHGGIKVKRGTLQLQLNSPIKKQRSPEQSPSAAAAGRKRVITSGGMEERLRRSKSEEMSNSSNGIITKQVFRNKVRRYKLLDEVSSQ